MVTIPKKEEAKKKKDTVMTFYLVGDGGRINVFTTLDRPLTEDEFNEVEKNLAYYRSMSKS